MEQGGAHWQGRGSSATRACSSTCSSSAWLAASSSEPRAQLSKLASAGLGVPGMAWGLGDQRFDRRPTRRTSRRPVGFRWWLCGM
eukprot:3591423-Rhodomonas_salina.1